MYGISPNVLVNTSDVTWISFLCICCIETVIITWCLHTCNPILLALKTIIVAIPFGTFMQHFLLFDVLLVCVKTLLRFERRGIKYEFKKLMRTRVT